MAENRKILEGGKKILLTKGALLKDAIFHLEMYS